MLKKGYTLIELLVTISIIAVLVGVITFTMNGARSSARDDRRKIDIELISAAMEQFYSDCGLYFSHDTFDCRAGHTTTGCFPQGASPITGVSWVSDDPEYGKQTCLPSNVYMEKIPLDPQYPTRRYRYAVTSTFSGAPFGGFPSSYMLCAALETAPSPAMDSAKLQQCGGNCGSVACNYYLESPRSH